MVDKRYVVGYARPCGNTWEVGRCATWDDAQALVEATRVLHESEKRRSVVFLYDDENPESGNIADLNPEDFQC